MYYIVLYYIILYYIILYYYTILYYIILYDILLCYIILYYINYIILYYIILYYIILLLYIYIVTIQPLGYPHFRKALCVADPCHLEASRCAINSCAKKATQKRFPVRMIHRYTADININWVFKMGK